jgi:hypothetical protein
MKDRFLQHPRRGLSRTLPRPEAGEAIGIGCRRVNEVGHARLEHLAVPGDGSRAHGGQRHAVVGKLSGDELDLLRATLGLPVKAGRLEGALVGLCAPAGEEGGGQVRIGDLAQASGQLDGRDVGGADVVARVREGRHLLGGRLGQLAATVADVHVPEAGQPVQEFAPRGIGQDGPIAPDPHMGVRMVRGVV